MTSTGCNALVDGCRITVTDEDGKEVLTTDDPKIESQSFTIPMNKRVMALRAGALEKGNSGGEFEAEEFDPSKPKFYASNVDGEVSL